MTETTDTPKPVELTPYSQRLQLMALACALAIKSGLRAGRYKDPEATEARFSDVLHIDLPTGQVTIHADGEDVSTAWQTLPVIERTWDGHDQLQAFAAANDFVCRVGGGVWMQAAEARIGARLFSVYLAEAAELFRKADELEAASTTDEGRRVILEVCQDLRARARQLETGLIEPEAERKEREEQARLFVEAQASSAEVEQARAELARLRGALEEAMAREVAAADEHGRELAAAAEQLEELSSMVAEAQESVAAETRRQLAAEVVAFSNRLDITGALQRVAAPALRLGKGPEK